MDVPPGLKSPRGSNGSGHGPKGDKTGRNSESYQDRKREDTMEKSDTTRNRFNFQLGVYENGKAPKLSCGPQVLNMDSTFQYLQV